MSAAAAWFVFAHGWTCYYGDAEAHLNIARRIFDSRTPGYDQLGSPWLPLPHLLMLPLVRVNAWWHNGLAGTIPSAICFVLAGTFLFAAAGRLFGATAGAVAAALFALNPNVLYLQATPMSEPCFWAAFLALLYFTVRFRSTQGWHTAIAAGVAAGAAAMSRYDGWFLLPFVALYFFLTARKRWTAAILFSAIAAAGPLWWLLYNWWLSGRPLDFYSGPYSALAIQGSTHYPGQGNWPIAWLYYRTAVELCAGTGLVIVGLAGIATALWKRAIWPTLFLALPPVFYIWSLHSSGNPIHLPVLPPFSYYNSRYGTEAIPLLAFGGAALAAAVPERLRRLAAVALVAASLAVWILHPSPERWITWKESVVNSVSRRAWTQAAADYLAPRYRPGAGILTSFGDVAGIYRALAVPLRDTLTVDNGLVWVATVQRPELWLHEEWAVAIAGDIVEQTVARSGRYRLEREIAVPGAPPIRIYKW
ncbi:MAG: glycosyltransferase family 39 protein [Bryobacteraceae bacterium]